MTDTDRSDDGLDPTDVEAEKIIPPEQAPMDDAAGGPQVKYDENQGDVTASGAE